MVGFYPWTTCRGSSCSNDVSWLVAPWPNAAICPLCQKYEGEKTPEKENEALLRTATMFKEFDCIGSGSLCRVEPLQPLTRAVPLARGPLGPSLSPSFPGAPCRPVLTVDRKDLKCQLGALSHPLAPGWWGTCSTLT